MLILAWRPPLWKKTASSIQIRSGSRKNSYFSQPIICEGANLYDQLVRLLVNGSSSGLKLKC